MKLKDSDKDLQNAEYDTAICHETDSTKLRAISHDWEITSSFCRLGETPHIGGKICSL